jgi:phosphate transport system substrate-binding protein
LGCEKAGSEKQRKEMKTLKKIFMAAGLAGCIAGPAGALEVDGAIAAYKKTSGISGQLNSIGSDTLANLMTLWAEGFRKEYPNVKVQVEAKGSSTAPPALIAGTSQMGPMSRAMKDSEIESFE